jgi:cell envelope-related function transcriptional attenuator common domain
MFIDGAFIVYNYGQIQPDQDNSKISKSQLTKIHTESSLSNDAPVNLLILGLDEEGIRTDVILLMNFEPEKSKLNILSIARDTKVFARGKYSKINSVYSAGKEQLVADTVKEITGLSVQYYVTMNFVGFRKLIDTLDGVVFNVPFNMDYDDPTQKLHIHLNKGVQRLNGKESEQLVRYRKGNRSNEGYIDGDIGRIKMQQDFIKAMIKQKLNLKYLNKVDDVFAILAKYMRTNFNISDFAHYIPSVRKIEAADVKVFTLPGDSKLEDKAWYYIGDKQKTEELIDNNFYK